MRLPLPRPHCVVNSILAKCSHHHLVFFMWLLSGGFESYLGNNEVWRCSKRIWAMGIALAIGNTAFDIHENNTSIKPDQIQLLMQESLFSAFSFCFLNFQVPWNSRSLGYVPFTANQLKVI